VATIAVSGGGLFFRQPAIPEFPLATPQMENSKPLQGRHKKYKKVFRDASWEHLDQDFALFFAQRCSGRGFLFHEPMPSSATPRVSGRFGK